MAKFMLVLGGAAPEKRSSAPDYEPIMAAYAEWTKDLAMKGHLVEAHKLTDGVGRRVFARSGEVMDGPFVETKETLGGYYILEAESLEAATALARRCPIVEMQGGFVEVRPVER